MLEAADRREARWLRVVAWIVGQLLPAEAHRRHGGKLIDDLYKNLVGGRTYAREKRRRAMALKAKIAYEEQHGELDEDDD